MKTLLMGVVLAGYAVSPVWANECPTLQAQIDEAVGNRQDADAANAKALAQEAWALHEAGKHAESVQKYDDAAKAAGIELKHAQ